MYQSIGKVTKNICVKAANYCKRFTALREALMRIISPKPKLNQYVGCKLLVQPYIITDNYKVHLYIHVYIYLNWSRLRKSISQKLNWCYVLLSMAVHILSTIFVPNLFNHMYSMRNLVE